MTPVGCAGSMSMRSIYLPYLTFVAFGLGLQFGCTGQTKVSQMIKGAVVAEDGQAITGARITVNGDPNQSAVTNAEGIFELSAKNASRYAVIVKADGYAFSSFPLISLNSMPLRFTLR